VVWSGLIAPPRSFTTAIDFDGHEREDFFMTTATARIDYIEMPAVDIITTKAFYTEAFGWDWVDYGPGYASHPGGHDGESVEVALSVSATVAPAHPPGDENGLGPLVLFSTDDLAAAEDAVRRAGGTITSGPYGYPGGRRFHFVDPSGNVLGVYQSIDVAPDGSG
jgi:predicted enzyme related to lactoylglutathione lyase